MGRPLWPLLLLLRLETTLPLPLFKVPLNTWLTLRKLLPLKLPLLAISQFKVPLPTWLTCPRLLRPRLPSRLPSMLMPMEKFLCPLPLCTLSLPLLLWLPQFWLLLITTTVTTVTPMPMQVMQVTQVTQATTVTPMPMLDTQDTPPASPSWLPPLLLKPPNKQLIA